MRRDILCLLFLSVEVVRGSLFERYCFLVGVGTSSGSWSTSDAAAARFSAWTAAQISSRYTGMDLGAAMPMRTLEPLTSMISPTTSAPTMIFSPGRRVMMSIGGLLLGDGSEGRAYRPVMRPSKALPRGPRTAGPG